MNYKKMLSTLLIVTFTILNYSPVLAIQNTKPNNFNINDLKSLHDSFKTICESDSTTTLIDLLKKIKYESNNLKFEEYC